MSNKFLITKDQTVKKAMQLINKNSQRCLIVVDGFNKMLGTLSDGDIRNALLKNSNMNDKVEKFYNRKAKFVYKNNYSKDDLKKLFKEKYDLIPILRKNKTVFDITYWSREFDKKIKPKKLNAHVIIMAGGEGTRLQPFTKVLPKPLIPINEKPVIEHIMEKFISSGISNFTFTINYKAEIIKAYFKEFKSNLKINFIEEHLPLGTAGAIKFLEKKIKKDFFVVNCDTIVDIDYGDLYSFHKKKGNDITIVASAKEYKIPYGVCKINNKGMLASIEEKPKLNFLASSGIYVLNPNIFKLIPKKEKFHFTNLISLARKKKLKITVYPIDDSLWLDVGQWNEYKKALKFL
jgi:dTDP-glucose pyrophosphorylase